MANNRVEIDVILNADKAEKGFDKLEEGSKAVGESFGSVGKAVSTLGGEANKALGEVGQSLGGAVDGFKNLASATKMGGASFTALLGPIGVAVMAVMELMQAFRNYSNEIDGTNIAVEAYKASASELTSIIEQLSDAQVKLNQKTISAFRTQSQRAQRLINEGELINQKASKIQGEIGKTEISIQKYQKLVDQAVRQRPEDFKPLDLDPVLGYEAIIQANQIKRTKLLKELTKLQEQSDQKSVEGAEERLKLTDMVDNKLKESPEFRKKIAEQEAKILSEARINELQATKDNIRTQIKIAEIGSKQKIREIKAIEDISQKVKNKAIKAEESRLQAEITAIEKAGADKRKLEAEKRRQRAKAERARTEAIELAKARQRQAELKIIRSLELESMRIQGASAITLAKERYKDELALAGRNANQKIIAEKRYQNEITRIEQEAQNKRFIEESRQAQQRSNFIFSSLEFDAQQIEDQTARELALLNLRYEKEIRLNQHTQEEITEFQRREAIERQKILDRSLNQSIDKLKSMSQDLLKESTGAIYQSLVDAGNFELQFEELKHEFDKEVGQTREEMLKAQASNDIALFQQKEQEITNLTAQYESERKQIRAQESQTIPLLFGNILKGLGQQASVEAVMELAKGFSKLGSPLTAGFAPAHFKASAIFAGVAATAGIGGAMLTNNANTAISRAGRGTGSTSATSPTGTPQTATTPDREQADTSSMVFNINFGGAVIYDTRRSAEQALADRITTIQNTRRRGAPRRGAM